MVAIVILLVIYFYYMKKFTDLIDKQTFFDNFFMSVLITLTATFLVLYNPIFRTNFVTQGVWWLATVMFIIIAILAIFLWIKIRPR
mgnify:CR=1 FL=1